jgi:type II secretory pathway component PulJ
MILKNNSIRHQSGVTLISFLISMSIFSILIVVIAVFQLAIFKSQKINEARSEIDQETLLLLRKITQEIRTAEQSNAGSYLIDTAEDNQLIFFSDLKSDRLIDRIRYTLADNTIVRGVTIPTGNPLQYILANETAQDLVSDVQEINPLFAYYGSDYNGVDQVDPLPDPINIADIKHIKIEFTFDKNTPGASPIRAATQVTLRDLRDL